jgi:hypothetical protein
MRGRLAVTSRSNLNLESQPASRALHAADMRSAPPAKTSPGLGRLISQAENYLHRSKEVHRARSLSCARNQGFRNALGLRSPIQHRSGRLTYPLGVNTKQPLACTQRYCTCTFHQPDFGMEFHPKSVSH